MLKAINVKLYPNSKQKYILECSFGCARKVYNLALGKSISVYKTDKTNMTNLAGFSKYLFSELLKNEEYSYLHNENTKILKGSLNNLSYAFANFFRNVKNKEKKKGFPKFKKKANRQTLSLEKLAFSKKVFDIPNKLFISKKYGFIHYLTSDKNLNYLMKYKDTVRSMTIVKLQDGEYYARIVVNSSEKKFIPKTDKIIGIDLGIKNMIITSDGKVFENKHFLKENEQKLKHLQQILSKKKKGSKNRNKARIRLAKLNQYINNCKKDYLNSITNMLINENQVICMEDLNIKGMMKNHHIAKSIQEVNLREIREILKYKCEWYGRKLVFVDRYFPSSKTCSVCGYKNTELTLKGREWTCPECGTRHDRDINAAVNILNEGKRIIGGRAAEFKPVENKPTCEVLNLCTSPFGESGRVTDGK